MLGRTSVLDCPQLCIALLGTMFVSHALPAQIKELPSNEESGVNIDRFIGHPSLSHVRISHEAIVTRAILTNGNPHQPNDTGAVLLFRKSLSLGTLWPGNQTPLVQLPDQQIIFVESGEGHLDNGSQYWDLRGGVAVLVPAGAKHRLKNTGEGSLDMLILTWQSLKEATPRSEILVRDVNDLPLDGKNNHWSYISKNIFNPADGLHPGESFSIIYMPPMTIAGPHGHSPGSEEVWVKLPPYSTYLFLGSEVRDMPPNTAFLAPPNDKTTHSVVNFTKDKTHTFIGFAIHPKWPSRELPSVEPKAINNNSVQ